MERFDLATVCLPAQIRLLEDVQAGRLPGPSAGGAVPGALRRGAE